MNKCPNCLGSGFIAINIANPNIVLPLKDVPGSCMDEYRLRKCVCQKAHEQQINRMYKAGAVPKQTQNWQQTSIET